MSVTGVSHTAIVSADLDRFLRFYEGVLGLDAAIVMPAAPEHGRHAIFFAGNAVLNVFEVDGYDPGPRAMFERGRIDHLGFSVRDEAALAATASRLVEAGASGGEIRAFGPVLSVQFIDPDGMDAELNCFNPAFVPPADDRSVVLDPDWLDRARRILQPI